MSETLSEHRCGNCARSYYPRPNGKVACGAAVDDEALSRMVVGNNPIWAWRKYGPRMVLALASGCTPSMSDANCDNMDCDDGAQCAAWSSAP